jgi:hypothetical protein
VAEVALLQPVVSALVGRCGATAAHLDWYLVDRPRPNAFSAGDRAVALTAGLRDAYATAYSPVTSWSRGLPTRWATVPPARAAGVWPAAG